MPGGNYQRVWKKGGGLRSPSFELGTKRLRDASAFSYLRGRNVSESRAREGRQGSNKGFLIANDRMCRCRYDVTSGRATRYPPIRTCSEEITVFAQRIGDPYSILPGGRERGKETGRSIILLTIARDFSRSIDKGNVVYRDFRKCLVSPPHEIIEGKRDVYARIIVYLF